MKTFRNVRMTQVNKIGWAIRSRVVLITVLMITNNVNAEILLGAWSTLSSREFTKKIENTTPAFVLGLKKKITPLPFDLMNFMSLCDPIIPRVKNIPQTTNKCAPAYYPYVARISDNDMIAKVIGRHHYIKGNPQYYQEYDNPVSHGLHPLYMVLPPLKDVLLVRVQDSEGNGEDRDVFSGAYLTIKNGKVIDQINEGCNMNSDYTCIDRQGRILFRVLENGKFEQFHER